jgi:hypothetical protein
MAFIELVIKRALGKITLKRLRGKVDVVNALIVERTNERSYK